MGFGGSGIAVIWRECLRMLPLARTNWKFEVMETGSGMYPVRLPEQTDASYNNAHHQESSFCETSGIYPEA